MNNDVKIHTHIIVGASTFHNVKGQVVEQIVGQGSKRESIQWLRKLLSQVKTSAKIEADEI